MADISYLTHFASVIEKTEIRVVNNYVLWRIAEWFNATFLGENIDGRWKYCLGILKSSFGDSFGSYFFNNSLEGEFKDSILELILYQQRELLDIFDNNDWLDKDAKENHAIEKILALNSTFGYFDEIMNHFEVSDNYKEIGFVYESFIEYYLKLRKSQLNNKFYDQSRQTFVLDLESNYNQRKNTLYLSAGYFQHPFFSKERPQYLNFGALGTIIGYNILKGYGREGFLVNKDGNMTKWKYDQTAKIFHEKVKCFKEQYQSYTTKDGSEGVPEQFVDDYLAESEGLRLAYKAYNLWVENNVGEAELPGLKYTPKQLFWISFANTKCKKARADYYTRQNIHNKRPWESSVITPVFNNPEFENDFKCKDGTNMNPKTKCQLW